MLSVRNDRRLPNWLTLSVRNDRRLLPSPKGKERNQRPKSRAGTGALDHTVGIRLVLRLGSQCHLEATHWG
jgi:hypothetical protein